MAGYARAVVKGNADARLRKIARQFRGRPNVKVGLPNGKADASIIESAIYNEFGTDTIPERPAHRLAIDTNKAEFRRIMRADAKLMVIGRMQMATHLNRLGAEGQGAIQDMITSLSTPENAQSTIDRKGSSNPLIDTGETRQSVTWVIDR